MEFIQRFQNRSIRFKLLIYFVIIILISIATLSAIGTTVYKRSIEDTTNKHTIQMMGQVKNNVIHYFNEMENILAYLANDDKVTAFFAAAAEANAADPGQAPLRADVGKVIGIYENRHPEIAGILMVNAADQYVSNKLDRMIRDPLTSESWYKQAASNPDEVLLISKPIGRNIKAEHNYSADQVLSFVQAIKDPATGGVLGVILLDMELSIIQTAIESVSLGKSGFVYITDAQGGIVYSPVNPIVYRINNEWLESGYTSIEKTINNRSYQIMQDRFEHIGWKIVVVFPFDEAKSFVIKWQFYTVVIVLFTVFLAVLVSWFFTNSIIKPVRKLRRIMQRVEEGELHLRFEGRSKDEIGQLGDSFNKMVQEIEQLIHMVYSEQKGKREAELKVLQEQIKPHFLYNTLDTIQWMAQDRDADDIVEIVIALTNLFRIGLSRGNEHIPLEDEIKHVESYLIIQMMRYEGKLSYQINELPYQLKKSKVLKLILQPLVENAIYHGIKMKKGKGHIRIESEARDGKLVLSVIDNGLGMKPEQLEIIRQGVIHVGNPEHKDGFGLFNVNERIRLTYGISYGIEVHSEYEAGTRVEVFLPL
ncbi:HAMP domain-containing protein [Cohnella fermenti]|uniref:histidine kinase n=1 Tax=Cohnella fermenti TaxID=2565925 RepID=A0A4S4BFZ5_9BACL|nr:HAMP domain-containing protein [Cohnella fermenti]